MDTTPFPDSNCPARQTIAIARSDRWQAYQRLQELEISCICCDDGRFQVSIHTPIAAVQLWSVMYQLTATRHQQIRWLEQCW